MDYGNTARDLRRVVLLGLVLGIVAVVVAFIGCYVQGVFDIRRWPAFVFLLFTPPTALFIGIAPSVLFCIRVSSGRIQHVFAHRFILSDYPVEDLVSVNLGKNIWGAVLHFTGDRKIRFFGAHFREMQRLAEDLSASSCVTTKPNKSSATSTAWSLVIIIFFGVVGIKGLFWVSRDTALTIASRHWVTGEAVIDRSWLDKTWSKGGQNYSLMMTYHFFAGGVRYKGDRFEIPSRRSGGSEEYFLQKLSPYTPGAAVKILYAKDPTRSVVTPPHLNYFFTIGLGGLSLLLCAIPCVYFYRLLSRRLFDPSGIERYAA